ncbi:RNA polymerase sigma factor [Sphingobacterium nematocida]|nr:sigma-70 family RNA polymerase sigma factor [Sphingobacterium nematocida]
MHCPIDDTELVLGLKKGEPWAYEEVYDQYADTLTYKLYRLVKRTEIVEELLQDTFLKLWNGRKNLTNETNIKAYLLVIAKNLAIDFFHRASKDKELERQLLLHVRVSYDHIQPLLEEKETLEVLEKLISQLPPQRQRVFRLIKLEGKTYEEASQYFGVSISTIKDHMAKSAVFLRDEIAKNHPEILFSLLVTLVFK